VGIFTSSTSSQYVNYAALLLKSLIVDRSDTHCDKSQKKKTAILVDVAVGKLVETPPGDLPHVAGPEYDSVCPAFTSSPQRLISMFRSSLLDTASDDELNMTK
jgi:hypothetical protein